MLKKIKSKTKGGRFKVWLEQSSHDLEAAKTSRDNGFYEWACFQSEQSVEKALKAVLVHAGWRPPKMHKLAVLMSYCNRANERFKKTKFEFRDLEAFTFVSRYPFLIPGQEQSPHDFITLDNAQICIHQASAFLKKIRQLLSG